MKPRRISSIKKLFSREKKKEENDKFYRRKNNDILSDAFSEAVGMQADIKQIDPKPRQNHYDAGETCDHRHAGFFEIASKFAVKNK